MKQILFLIIFIKSVLSAYTQEDTIHYISPFYFNNNYSSPSSSGHFDKLYVVLSTFETTPFNVNISTKDGSYDSTVSISTTTPQYLDLGSKYTAALMVDSTQLNKPLSNEGFVISGSKKFFVNISESANNHAEIITTKGRVGLGKEFYTGHLYSVFEGTGPTDNKNRLRHHFISFIASENNTFVTVSNPRVNFEGHATKIFTVILQAGQSYVLGFNFYNKTAYNDITINDVNGTHITSNKPISVTSGTWTGGRSSSNSRDVGIDQIVPVEVNGNEYVLSRGKGNDFMENIIVVATQPFTKIFINGSLTEYATVVNSGDYIVVPESQFDENGDVNENIYIKSDKSIYVYQSFAGSTNDATPGLIAVPRLSCNASKQVQISFANLLANPSLTLSTQYGSIVTINGNDTISGERAVAGNSDWVTYNVNNTQLAGYNPGPNWNFKIVSTGALNAALIVESAQVGGGGYFSGFGTQPSISVAPNIVGQGLCSGNAKIIATGFVNYTWYKDGNTIPGLVNVTTNEYIASTPGRYKVVGVNSCGNSFPSNELLISPCLSVNSLVTDVTETAGGTTQTFTINLSNAYSEDDVTFNYSTQSVTASSGLDYTATSGIASIAAGSTSTTVTVPVLDDALAEDNETYKLIISSPVNAVISDTSATAAIIDDGDPKPVVNISADKSVSEAGGVQTYTLTLDRQSGQTITVDYAISDVTTTQGNDYSTPYSGTITFAPLETSKTISLNVTDDNVYEPGAAETLNIALSNLVNVIAGAKTTASCSISDNDTKPLVTITPTNNDEGASVSFTIGLSHPSQQTVAFDYNTSDATATSPADYTSISITGATIAAYATSSTITVSTFDDAIIEPNETFNFNVSNLVNAEFSGGLTFGSAIGTIIDNETPQVSIDDASGSEGGSIVFTVRLNRILGGDVTFNYQTANNSATAPTDYTAILPTAGTITAGNISTTITVNTIEDTDEEGNETILVLLSAISGATFADDQATGTIVDDDNTPTAVIDNITVTEDIPYSGNLFTNDALGDLPTGISANTSPSHGSLSAVNVNTGAFTYTPNTDYNGTDAFTYTIRDVDNDESTATVNITVNSANDVPDAINDNYTIAENGTLSNNVKTNDLGMGDGGITVSLVSNVSHGSLTLNNDGTFSYTPTSQYFGTDQFIYQLSDINGETDNATVVITINYSNDSDPFAVDDTYGVLPNSNNNILNLYANDTDADGNSTLDLNSINIISGPSHGTYTLPGNGTIVYTPTAAYSGSDMIAYKISDNGGRSSNTASANITIETATIGLTSNAFAICSTTGTALVTASYTNSLAITYPVTVIYQIAGEGSTRQITTNNGDMNLLAATNFSNQTALNTSKEVTLVSATDNNSVLLTISGTTMATITITPEPFLNNITQNP